MKKNPKNKSLIKMIRIITLGVCCGLFIWFGAVSASADPILTPQQAVSEMTWGVNLTTLYMADKVYEEGEGNSLGYGDPH